MTNAANHPAPSAVVDLKEGTVTAIAEIPAPPKRVFRALTTDEVERWWGTADTYRMTQWIADPAGPADLGVGGRWSAVVRGANGRAYPASGVFLEIDAPRKIVMTRTYEWDHPTLGRRETTLTYRLDQIPGGTRLTVLHEGFAGLGAAAKEHAGGWERVLGWLEEYLREGGPGGHGCGGGQGGPGGPCKTSVWNKKSAPR